MRFPSSSAFVASALALGAASWAWAPSAQAADPVAVAPAVLPAGAATENVVALGPGRVLWVEANEARSQLRMRSAVLGSAATTLYKVPKPSDRDGHLEPIGIAASATRTAFGYGESVDSEGGGDELYRSLYAGPLGGPFPLVAGGSKSADPRAQQFDLSGDALATIVRTGNEDRASVRDLATGGAARDLGVASRIHVAGAFVAVAAEADRGTETSTIRVVNWQTGAELYRVTAPLGTVYGFPRFDVQEDGTLAVLTPNPTSTGSKPVDDLSWASAVQPTLHLLASDVQDDVVRIAQDHIVFARRHGADAKELAVTDLAGSTRAVSFPVDFVTGADFDGQRLAFTTYRCVYAGDLPATAPSDPPPGTCPQDTILVRSVGSDTSRNVAKVQVTCRMGPVATGCRGTVVLQIPGKKGKPALRLASRTFTAPLHGSTTVSIKVPAKSLRILRRSRTVPRRGKTVFPDVVATAVDTAGLKSVAQNDVALRP